METQQLLPEPDRLPALSCSRQHTHSDFPWNLNQETFERVPPAGRLPHSKGGDIVALFHPLKRGNPWDWACVLERKQTGMCVRATSFVSKRGFRSLRLLDCEEANKSKRSIGVEPPRWSHQSGLIFLLDPKFPVLSRKYNTGEVTFRTNESVSVPSYQNFAINIFISLLLFQTFSPWKIFFNIYTK